MKKLFLSIITLIIGTILISGCLTVEKKEYKLKLTGPTSGKGSIKYINIVSQKDNENKDVSLKDFAELITDYYQGDKFEKEFPELKNVQKKLYVENDVLVAEVTFDFDSLSHFKIFQYDKDSPYMVLIKESFNSEEYAESNGEYNLNNLPVIFWKKNTKEFTWKTTVTSDVSKAVVLVQQFQNWEKTNK
jgi:hypothetical protein